MTKKTINRIDAYSLIAPQGPVHQPVKDGAIVHGRISPPKTIRKGAA
jgi:hypothetical protein